MSSSQVVQIANSFLLNAPPGEFLEVVTDVRALLPDEKMLDGTAPTTFKKYNEDQQIQADSEDGSHRFLVTPYAEVGTNEYIDHEGGVVATFDHIKQVVTGSRPISSGDEDASLAGLRAELQAELAPYVKEHYPFGTLGVYAREGKLYVCITSTRFNPNNFWNGRWRSCWTISKNGEQLDARIRLQVHYYEDGNVQLQTDTSKSVAGKAGNAKEIAKAIQTAEHNFHQALNTSYELMGENTFKYLRRALPISGKKIVWGNIVSYRVGVEAVTHGK